MKFDYFSISVVVYLYNTKTNARLKAHEFKINLTKRDVFLVTSKRSVGAVYEVRASV